MKDCKVCGQRILPEPCRPLCFTSNISPFEGHSVCSNTVANTVGLIEAYEQSEWLVRVRCFGVRHTLPDVLQIFIYKCLKLFQEKSVFCKNNSEKSSLTTQFAFSSQVWTPNFGGEFREAKHAATLQLRDSCKQKSLFDNFNKS